MRGWVRGPRVRWCWEAGSHHRRALQSRTRVLILNGPCACMVRLGCSSRGEGAFRRQWRASSERMVAWTRLLAVSMEKSGSLKRELGSSFIRI